MELGLKRAAAAVAPTRGAAWRGPGPADQAVTPLAVSTYSSIWSKFMYL